MRVFAALVVIAMAGGSAQACPVSVGFDSRHRVCSCLAWPWSIPADEATDVPTNAKIWLPVDLSGRKVTLFGPGGPRELGVLEERTPPDPRRSRRTDEAGQRFDPGPLQPHALYWVTLEDYGTLTTFTTGDLPEERPPRAATIRWFDIDVVDRTIDRRAAVDLDVDVPPDAVALEVTLRDDEQRVTTTVSRNAWKAIGDGPCGAEFYYRSGKQVCLDIDTIDVAGNHGTRETRCTVVEERTGNISDERDLAVPRCDRDVYRSYSARPRPDYLLGIFIIVGLGGFMFAMARLVWRAHPPRLEDCRVTSPVVLEHVARRVARISQIGLAISVTGLGLAVTHGAPRAIAASLAFFGIATYELAMWIKAARVGKLASRGAACLAADERVGVICGTRPLWLHVGKSSIARAEAAAVPGARALKFLQRVR
jgi:hypothetical protein